MEGMDADLVLVDMENRRSIRDADTWTRVGWTPYEGMPLVGWPVRTFVDGRTVFGRNPDNPVKGEVSAEPSSSGRALSFS